MRTLLFIVDGQKISKSPKCDFSGISPGTSGYLMAKFRLGREWKGCRVAASFWSLGKEYPVIVNSDGTCIIPGEALAWSNFKVSITGVDGDYKITTNKVTVEQEG